MGIKEDIEAKLLEMQSKKTELEKELAKYTKMWKICNEDDSSEQTDVKRKPDQEHREQAEQTISYPIRDSFQKVDFIINSENRVLIFEEIADKISSFEGNSSAKKTIRDLKKQLPKLIRSGRIYPVRFGNSKRYTTYGSNQNWIDKSTGSLKEEYYPLEHILAHIKRPDLVVITNNYKE